MIRFASAAIIGLIVLTGCAGNGNDSEGADPVPVSSVVLVDVSDSARQHGLLDRVPGALDGIMGDLPDDSVLNVVFVDGAAQASSCEPLEIPFQMESLNETDLVIERATRRKDAQQAVQDSYEACSPTFAPGSDLFGGFMVAADELRSDAGKREIWVLSDGAQATEEFHTGPKTIATPAARKALLAELHRKGLIPDLEGAVVHVQGGGVGQTRRSASEAVALEQFWTAYLDQANAELAEYKN